MKTHQYELRSSVGEVINLVVEDGNDPVRLALEAGRRAADLEAARAYADKMQRLLAECPGFVGADAPSCASSSGKVVVDPGRIVEATAWLKRRFHVSENLGLSHDQGLCVEVIPRETRKQSGKRSKPLFGKPTQFELNIQ